MAGDTAYLLIDISNSFTKLAFASKKKIARTTRIPTQRLNTAYLRSLLRRKVDAIIVSSVVPEKNREVVRASKGTKVLWLKPGIKFGVGIDYPKPGTIGADRLANAAA